MWVVIEITWLSDVPDMSYRTSERAEIAVAREIAEKIITIIIMNNYSQMTI